MTQQTPVVPLETYGPREWIQLAGSESVKATRTLALKWWALGSGFPDPEPLFSMVKNGEDPYSTANRMVEKLLEEKKRNGTILLLRGKVKEFYKFADIPFKEDLYERRVKRVKKLMPMPGHIDPERVPELFRISPLGLQALFAFLISTGCRIGDALKVRVQDIQFGQMPGRVLFYADQTKTGEPRVSFLTTRTLALLKEWLLEQYGKGVALSEEQVFAPLHSEDNAYHRIMPYLKKAELTEIGHDGKWTVHPHTFRTFNLNQAKKAGYDRDWAETLVGHNIGVQAHYQDIEEMAGSWLEKVEPRLDKLMFYTEPDSMQKPKEDLDRKPKP